jgi:soluble lytic murein transglycosylase-like protein
MIKSALILLAISFGFCFGMIDTSEAQAPAQKTLAQAMQALAKGEASRAKTLLAGPCNQKKLKGYWLRGRAEAFVQLGQEELALKTYAGILVDLEDLKGDHPFRIQIETAWAELAAKHLPATAANRLGQAAHPPEHWARAAELYRSAQKEKPALQLERRLLIKAPQNPVSRKLAGTLGPTGVARLLRTTKARMERVRALLAAHENEQAITEATGLKKGFACEKLYIIGKAQRKTRQYRAAIKTLRKARSVCDPKSHLWMRASLLSAQLHTIKRQARVVQRIVTRMRKNQPQHSFIDDGLMQLAKAFDRIGEDGKARAVFKEIIEKYADGDQVNFAAWRIAYTHIRKENFDLARPWLKELGGRHKAQAAYWMARGQESKNKNAAIKALQALVLSPPLSFYSWLALWRLDEISSPHAQDSRKILREKQAALSRPGFDTHRRFASEAIKDAQALKQSGLAQDAIREITWWANKKRSQTERQEAVTLLHSLQAFSEAQHILRWYLPHLLDAFPVADVVDNWRHAYSLAFQSEIETAAKQQGFDPLFLFALSREESTFDPEIISWAGATGLCQLMPATAIAAYADLYRKRLVDLDRLLNPKLNAQLGAHVLNQGLKRFGKVEALALAAYNAGPRFALSSLPRKKAQAFDFWVESIKIRETRRYIKKVLQTYGRYRFLHGKPGDFLSFPKMISAIKPAPSKSKQR